MKNSRPVPRVVLAILAGAGLAPAPGAFAQCDSPGPDVIAGEITSVANYAVSGELDALAIGVTLCNIGDAPVQFRAQNNQHPIITQNLYRLRSVDGATRFEQIGVSWCFHTFFALSTAVCCTNCQPGDGTTLGVRCSDPETASRIGSQLGLGPRRQVDASTGVFTFPPANPPFSGSTARRLQVRLSDLDPDQYPGAQFFAEAITVAPDDALAANNTNNASYRACSFVRSTPQAGFSMTLAGTTARSSPAVYAWAAADPDVVIVEVDIPGDGRFLIGARATQIASATWRYEYAVQNLSSHRAGRSWGVPRVESARSLLANLGFHDVTYRDGDGENNVSFDGTDWTPDATDKVVTWTTDDESANPNANALRWGTLYNFRFDTNAPPVTGAAQLGLFRGPATSIEVVGLPVPGDPCPGDWNADGELASQDFFDFLGDFFGAGADVNDDGVTDSRDFFDFVASFLGGC